MPAFSPQNLMLKMVLAFDNGMLIFYLLSNASMVLSEMVQNLSSNVLYIALVLLKSCDDMELMGKCLALKYIFL